MVRYALTIDEEVNAPRRTRTTLEIDLEGLIPRRYPIPRKVIKSHFAHGHMFHFIHNINLAAAARPRLLAAARTPLAPLLAAPLPSWIKRI